MKIRTFAKLGDICDVSAGQGAPQGDSNYCDNGTPFVKAGNLIELIQGKKETEIQKVSEDVAKKHKLKKYPAGSLLFAKSGMSCMKGYVYQLKNDSYVVSHLAIVKPKKDSSDYIEYCLRHIKPNSLVKDEAYPSISLQDISNLEIPLPSLEEQVKIADQLSKCTQIINKHKEQLEKYDFLIKSRFIEMFGDPIENTKSWIEEPLGNCCLLKAGKAIKASELADKDKEHPYPCFGGNGIRGFISKKSHTGKIVLIGRQGALCGNVQLTDGDFYATEHAVVTSPKKELNSIWLYHLLFLMDLNRYKSGAAQPGLTVEKLNTVPTMIVPIELQNDFAAFVQQIDKSKFEIWLYLNLCYIIEKRVFTYD